MQQFPNLQYPIIQRFLPVPSKRRSGIPAHPIRFLVAHDTGTPASTAAGNVQYYGRSCQLQSASAHLFVDDKQILECVPALTAPPEKAWHVLYNCSEDKRRYQCSANDAAIGVEYCFGPNINSHEAYQRYVWVLAYACWRFRLDPARDIVGHHVLDPRRKTDPFTGLAHSLRTYQQLLLDVPAMYAQCTGGAPAETELVAETGIITTGTRLNVRHGEPFRRAPGRIVPAGQQLPFLGRVTGEAIGENDRWYALPNNEYCWSGGIREVLP